MFFKIGLKVLCSHNGFSLSLYFLPYFKNATLPGLGTSSSLKISAICLGLIPEAYISNILTTIGAISSSMTNVFFASVPFRYPYGTFEPLYMPSIACVLFIARIFFDVFAACHSLKMFIMGIISIALLSRFAVSTLSCMAINLTPNDGNT